ncbi:MAG: glycine zipper 2TM domain-containing protein [Nitrospinae bacterium]|nr:glycine zipper 2TM domain-containing protein [Nitrospinota bacterium]
MRIRYLIALVAVAFAAGACASPNQQRDAAVGAALGAGAGAIIGHQYGEGGRDKGALIGAAVGGAAGLMHGQQEDAMSRPAAGAQQQQPMAAPGYRPGPPPGGPQSPGGDDFRNPYRMPNPQLCRGQWVWDPGAGFWVCR